MPDLNDIPGVLLGDRRDVLADDLLVTAVDAEAMEMGVAPAEGDLDDVMELGDGTPTVDQDASPDHGADLPDPVGDQLADGEVFEEVIAGDDGPGAFEQAAAFLAEVFPRVEQVAGLVVVEGDHATSMAPAADFVRFLADPSKSLDIPGGEYHNAVGSTC